MKITDARKKTGFHKRHIEVYNDICKACGREINKHNAENHRDGIDLCNACVIELAIKGTI